MSPAPDEKAPPADAGTLPTQGGLRSRLSLLLKAIITVALIVVIARNVDVKAVSERLLVADPRWAAVALAFFALQLVLGALRWRRICDRLGLSLARGAAIRLVFIGHFFSQALPTAVGGDVVRAWLTTRETGAVGRSVSSVLCDRALAFGVLLLIASAGQLLVGAELRHPALGPLRMVLWAVTLAAVLTLLFGAELARPLARFRAGALIRRVLLDVRSVLGPPWSLAAIIGVMSLGVQLSILTGVYFLARSLSLPLDLVLCLVMIPPILVATLIPVSIGGWGVREGAMVLGLSMVGVSGEGALALSILYGLGNLVVSIPGGLLWLAARGR
ncbi:MAG TPA: lysylphosphatidylglycerol synthase transmembrane domain-containing protein [Usitatibacter sp.]|nr:lysylphosphatidylglycerol synthase transmembrane domain-containing protein [Usitatibacter sp.]